MSAVLKVKRALKEYSPADNANVLRIEFSVEDEEGVKEFNQAFPLGTTKDEMKAGLKKFLDTFLTEKEQKVQNEALEKAEADTDETIKELENYTISEDGTPVGQEKLEEVVKEAVSSIETSVEEKPV